MNTLKICFIIAALSVITFMQAQGVGIGTISFVPVSKLDVLGNVTVGASYAGVNAAPSNGLIVQGNVGIVST